MLRRMAIAFIGLGSNLGRREDTLRAAIVRVGELPGNQVLAVAGFRETEPVDCAPEAGRFINSVMKIETTLDVATLFKDLMKIECELGRIRASEGVHEARSIDLDLILFGDEVRNSASLVLPHPRMHERAFVLEPMVEIAAEFRHPILGKTMRELLLALEAAAHRRESA